MAKRKKQYRPPKKEPDSISENCVYCGRPLCAQPVLARVHTRSFGVCSEECRARTEEYVQKDKRFKTVLYLLVFAGGIGFVISAFLGEDRPLHMLWAYIGQFVAGAAFIAFPYPISSFESFHAMSIRGVTRLTRLIGLVLSLSAAALLVMTVKGA